jgi:hypothetical protein
VTRDSFQIVGDSLMGHGLSFDLNAVTVLRDAPDDRCRAIVDMANVIYKQGRESAQLSYDDRFDLDVAVDALRSLGTIVGFPTGDRYRRCADIVARLLQEQRG